MKNDLFLRACRREDVERTPVWMMRQAGRYLPEYRAVRSKTDFLSLCKTPELAATVTLQPVEILGVDAAIIFSDILLVPEAMGMELFIDEPGGPRFRSPLKTKDDIDALVIKDPGKSLRFVLDAIALAKRGLNVPLIGFCGSPWTLAAYMIEGKGTGDFHRAKKMMVDEPEVFSALMEKLSRMVQLHLEAQIDAGADAVQIFDTWGGILTPDLYKKWSLDWMFKIVSTMDRDGAPVIIFSKGANHSLKDIGAIGADVIGIDWTVDIADVRNLMGGVIGIQGNLDPSLLFASPGRIRQEVISILRKYGEAPGHIFNLGHGIAPDVPVEHARAFVQAVKEESIAFHPGRR